MLPKKVIRVVLIICVILLGICGYYIYNKIPPPIEFLYGLIILLFTFMYAYLICFIIQLVKNKRRFKKFRNELKVGDKTAQGIVLEIGDDYVILKDKQFLSNIYPPENR